MYIVKVMKRKDATSVVVAVFIAMALAQWLPAMVGKLSSWTSGVPDEQVSLFNVPEAGWQTVYLLPTVLFLMQIVALELLLWIVIWLHPMFVRKAK